MHTQQHEALFNPRELLLVTKRQVCCIVLKESCKEELTDSRWGLSGSSERRGWAR